MATYAITIAGNSKSILIESLSITEMANGRNTATFDILSSDGSYRPSLDDEVIITEDGTRIFGGVIDMPVESGMAGYGTVGLIHRISAVDYNSFADRRFYNGTIAAGTLKSMLQSLVLYLSPYGVTLDGTQVDGPSLPELPLEYVALSEVFNQLANLSGYVWDIDYDKKLKMVLPASNSAPFGIVNNDGHVIGDIKVEPIRSYYANRIVFRYTSAATSAYCYMVVTSGNFVDGDVVRIGSTDYTFRNTPSATNDVQVGANSDASLQNLSAAINATALCWSNYGEGYWGSTHGLRIIATAPGAAGNSIAVSSTNPIGVFRSEGYTSVVTTLVLGADAALTNVAIAEDLAEQAAHYIWEKIISDATITNATIAQDAADAYLARSIAGLKKVTYDTFATGLHPGQVQTITVTTRNLSGSFIITDVRIVPFGGNLIKRSVTAAGGTSMPYTWQDDAKKIFGGAGGSTTAVSYGGGGAATVLSSPFPLGGARERSISCGTTPTPVLDYLTYEAAVSFTATVRVDVKAYDAGVAVTPGFYNMTDNTWTWGSAITSTSFSTQDIVVYLTAGKVYRLGVKTDNANGDAYCIGKLVA